MDTRHTDPIIHIGYHKSATSYLQQNVFSDENVFVQPWGIQPVQAIEHFVLCHPERFDAAAVRNSFFSNISQNNRTIPVLSHEGLSGNPMFGRYDMDRVAQRLHSVFPKAKIVIGIREQNSMIFSLYFQYVRQGGSKTLQQLMRQNVDRMGFRPTLRMDHLEYDLTVAHYEKLFSKGNVFVLPIELLRAAPESYFQMLSQFLEIEGAYQPVSKVVNARRSEPVMQVERILNKFIPAPADKSQKNSKQPLVHRAKSKFVRTADAAFGKGAGKSWSVGDLSKSIEEFVGDHFMASNRRTSDLIGMDLREFGYHL